MSNESKLKVSANVWTQCDSAKGVKQNPLADMSPVLVAKTLNDLINGYSLDVVVHEWLVVGLLAYVRGQAGSLDEALGLASGGRAKPRRIIAMHVRDRYLAKAVESISLDERVSTWLRCQRLEEQIGRLIPVWRSHYANTRSPAQSWEQWKCDLFLAWRVSLQGGGNIPETAAGLFEATKRTLACSFGSDELTMASRYFLE